MTSALLNLTQTAIWGALGNFSPLVIPVIAKVKIDCDYTITERNRNSLFLVLDQFMIFW